jgi:DNA polymerase III epsilon subunit-like protein
MTELAIVNVAYDAEGDQVVGTLEEYCMDLGGPPNETKALSVLERADFVVAHNAFIADRPLLAKYLPGTEKMQWLCSFRGIDWKQLLGVQSESLEVLMGKAGLRYEQDHRARADARDLKNLLAVKHRGRTYLGRLLDSAEAKT